MDFFAALQFIKASFDKLTEFLFLSTICLTLIAWKLPNKYWILLLDFNPVLVAQSIEFGH